MPLSTRDTEAWCFAMNSKNSNGLLNEHDRIFMYSEAQPKGGAYIWNYLNEKVH